MVWLARTKDFDPTYPVATLHKLVFPLEKNSFSWRNKNPLGYKLYLRYLNVLISLSCQLIILYSH